MRWENLQDTRCLDRAVLRASEHGRFTLDITGCTCLSWLWFVVCGAGLVVCGGFGLRGWFGLVRVGSLRAGFIPFSSYLSTEAYLWHCLCDRYLAYMRHSRMQKKIWRQWAGVSLQSPLASYRNSLCSLARFSGVHIRACCLDLTRSCWSSSTRHSQVSLLQLCTLSEDIESLS